jgi:pentapeptide MXKDX repeat protein
MKRLGTAALAFTMTLAMATGSFAQTGRDAPQNGTSGTTNQNGGMGQKGSSMQNKNMQNDSMKKGDTMERGSSGNK